MKPLLEFINHRSVRLNVIDCPDPALLGIELCGKILTVERNVRTVSVEESGTNTSAVLIELRPPIAFGESNLEWIVAVPRYVWPGLYGLFYGRITVHVHLLSAPKLPETVVYASWILTCEMSVRLRKENKKCQR
jgi:hypothetical protein